MRPAPSRAAGGHLPDLVVAVHLVDQSVQPVGQTAQHPLHRRPGEVCRCGSVKSQAMHSPCRVGAVGGAFALQIWHLDQAVGDVGAANASLPSSSRATSSITAAASNTRAAFRVRASGRKPGRIGESGHQTRRAGGRVDRHGLGNPRCAQRHHDVTGTGTQPQGSTGIVPGSRAKNHPAWGGDDLIGWAEHARQMERAFEGQLQQVRAVCPFKRRPIAGSAGVPRSVTRSSNRPLQRSFQVSQSWGRHTAAVRSAASGASASAAPAERVSFHKSAGRTADHKTTPRDASAAAPSPWCRLVNRPAESRCL